MNVTLETLATASVLLFVVSSMASMGLSLTMGQILAALRDRRLVVAALALNFVVAPAIAFGLGAALPVPQDVAFGLILLSTAAGAPFLPKLAEVAKADTAAAVGLMVLLMVATIVYVPLVLPLLVEGVGVQPGKIAQSLVVLMLTPLSLGLIARARYGDAAAGLAPVFSQAANVALLLIIVLGVGLNFRTMIGFIGSYGILAAVVFIGALVGLGVAVGGSTHGRVLGLASGQRNISAALVVAAQNFDPEVLSYLIVVSVIGLLVLMPTAAEWGRRARRGVTGGTPPSGVRA